MEQREFSLENLLLASQENHNQETSTVFTQIVSGPLMPAVIHLTLLVREKPMYSL